MAWLFRTALEEVLVFRVMGAVRRSSRGTAGWCLLATVIPGYVTPKPSCQDLLEIL